MNSVEAYFKVKRGDSVILETPFTLPDSGITALFGPSGSGKSTLLQCIAGLVSKRDSAGSQLTVDGEIWMSESDYLAPDQRSVGLIFQQPQLFPHLSVLKNLQFARERRRKPAIVELEDVVESFDLSALLDRLPPSLSGGEAQRVAMARTLVNGPRLLLFDEPLTALDHESRSRLLTLIHQLGREKKIPMLYVSHQWDEILQIADHVHMIAGGRINRSGSLQALTTDLDFLSRHQPLASAILITEVEQHLQDEHLTQVALGSQSLLIPKVELNTGKELRVLVKMADVSLSSQPSTHSSILNTLVCRIVDIAEHEGHAIVVLNCEGQVLSAKITGRSARQLGLTTGQSIYAQIKATTLNHEHYRNG
jgi:molybdate transport system ATP-binding protein